MREVEQTSNRKSRGGRRFSAVILFIAVVYVTLFWGRAASLLPQPLDAWGRLLKPTLDAWWTDNPALWLAAHTVVGMVLPGAALWAMGCRLTDAGLGLPDALGRRMITAGVVLSTPIGLLLTMSIPHGAATTPINLHYICSIVVMIPEHFLISGVLVALMLPGRKLPHPMAIAPVTGGPMLKTLRWLGLAQPTDSTSTPRFLSWWGLGWDSLTAVLASGMLFGLVHIGKSPLETALSFPGGAAVAYVTLRSHSIWPAIIAHWTLNLLPLALLNVM